MEKVTLRERIARRALKPEMIVRLAEYHKLPIGSGSSDEIDSDAGLYRPLMSTPMIDRSLDTYDQEKLIKVADYLYKTNVLARRSIKLISQYVIGPSGFKIKAKHEKVQAVLDEHWNDPVNNWPINQRRIFETGLFKFGEFIPRMFVNEANGHTTIGIMDPIMVKEILVNPENINETIGISQKTSLQTTETITWSTVRLDTDGNLSKKMDCEIDYAGRKIDTKGRLIGDAFYFGMDQEICSKRSYSPLLPVADWLDAYSRFVFLRAENSAVADQFAFDITCEDYNKDQLKEFEKNLDKKVGAGKYRIHNNKVKWETISANRQASDAREDAKMLMGMILAGLGSLIHWITGQGETINKASSENMADPVIAQLEALQNYYAYIIKQILKFHLDQVFMFSSIKLKDVKPEEEDFDVIGPPIDVGNEAEESETLSKDTTSIIAGEMQGYIDTKTAANLYCQQASRRFNCEVLPSEELENEEKVKETKLLTTYGKAHGY